MSRLDEAAEPEYVFAFDVIASDREGYYYDDWDKSTRFEVIGKTKQAAHDTLLSIVGTAPRGRFWKARQVGTATDVRLHVQSDTKRAAPNRVEQLVAENEELKAKLRAFEECEHADYEALRFVSRMPTVLAVRCLDCGVETYKL